MSEKEESEKEEKGIDITLQMKPITDVLGNQTKILERIEERLEGRAEGGEGQLIAEDKDKLGRIVESLHKVREEGWTLKEQWSVVVPYQRTKEAAAHLRDAIFVSDVVKGDDRPGDQVNIPYVKDADFQILSNVGDTFKAETTGLVSSTTTTLYEAGLYYDLPYYLLERINQNLLQELNGVFANAAVRAEDEEIMTLIVATTKSSFAGQVGRSTGSAYFYAANIAQAIGKLKAAGKEVTPGQCVAYLTGNAYSALLEELVASTVIAYAVPGIVTQGIIEKYLGVKIVVGGYTPRLCRTSGATGTVDVCFLMRGRRAVVLAPKREILIETQKQVAERELRIVPSHTFAVKLLDAGEIVRILTSFTS